MDVGAELRQAREQRGLSLHEISDRTKISVRALRAIENNEIEQLPGGIFTRGFLKSYAREVGLDPAELSQRYAAQFERPAPPEQPIEPEGRPPAGQNPESRDDTKPPTAYRLERARTMGAIAVLLVALSYFAFSRWHGSGPVNRVERARSGDIAPAAGSSHPKAAPIREVAPTTGSIAAASPAVTILRVDLQPPLLCWVSATSDGRRVMYRLMAAGERQSIEARDELVLRVGDPARFAFSINGSAGRLPGRPGQPTTVRITPRNYKEFLGR